MIFRLRICVPLAMLGHIDIHNLNHDLTGYDEFRDIIKQLNSLIQFALFVESFSMKNIDAM